MFKSIRNKLATFLYIGDDDLVVEFQKLKFQNARYKKLLMDIRLSNWEIDNAIATRFEDDLPKSIDMGELKISRL